MSHRLCVAWMRRSIHLIRGYPLRSFKRKCIVLNYSYLNSCIIPGFDFKKRISKERLYWKLEMGLNPDCRVELQPLFCAKLSSPWEGVCPSFCLKVKQSESVQKIPESLWRAGFVFLVSGFKLVLILLFRLYQKTVNKTWWGNTTFLCHSCTSGCLEKCCTCFHQKGPNPIFLFHSVKILKNFKANWNLSEMHYQAKKAAFCWLNVCTKSDICCDAVRLSQAATHFEVEQHIMDQILHRA